MRDNFYDDGPSRGGPGGPRFGGGGLMGGGLRCGGGLMTNNLGGDVRDGNMGGFQTQRGNNNRRGPGAALRGEVAAQAAETKSKEEEAAEEAARAKEEKKKKVAEQKAVEKAAKEAAKKAEEDAKAKTAEAAEAALGAAATLVDSGKVGNELAAACAEAGGGTGVTARALAAAVLKKAAGAGNLTGTEWMGDEQFGAALKNLCAGKGAVQKQAGILYACQEAYHSGGFPKTAESNKDGKKESYLEKLFFELYDKEIVEEEAFHEWRYADDDDEKDPNFVPGKVDALFQISDFLKWLDEPPEEESGEEDDEDEEDELPPAPVPM